jgi:signal transduction histidine kinase
MMLRRLEENKKELEENIASLERANLELKKAQQEIIRSEKMASVGRLATGLAHEIGNPIGIVLGYLELLKRGDMDDDEKDDFLKRTESEISRIDQIIRQLLDYSRPTNGERQETRVHSLIEETVEMLKPQPMMEHIQVELDLKATHDTVLADPNQLKQVFLNIIINAADAMGSDKAPEPDGQSQSLLIRSDQMARKLVIDFIDSGPGIPEEELGQIFDPFYTTKEPGKGTGLGLAVSYRIIEGFGGSIRAENTPERGTKISIDFPFQPAKNNEDLTSGDN